MGLSINNKGAISAQNDQANDQNALESFVQNHPETTQSLQQIATLINNNQELSAKTEQLVKKLISDAGLSGANAQNTVKDYALQTQTQTLRSNSSKHIVNDGVEQSTTPSSGLHSTPAGPTIKPGTSDGINIRNNATSSNQKNLGVQRLI